MQAWRLLCRRIASVLYKLTRHFAALQLSCR